MAIIPHPATDLGNQQPRPAGNSLERPRELASDSGLRPIISGAAMSEDLFSFFAVRLVAARGFSSS
jgi:hypothetical protein